MNNRKSFLEAVTPLFLRTGYKTLRMDDIADELSISKKTIYKLFSTKESLINAVNENLYSYFEKLIHKHEPECANAVELIYTLKHAVEDISDLEQQRRFIKQIARFDQELLKHTLDFARNAIYKVAQHTTQRAYDEGILLGVYDHDTINQLFANNYVSVKLYTDYETPTQFRRIEKEWFYMHLRGCFNLKGIELLDEYIAKKPEALHEVDEKGNIIKKASEKL